MKKIIIVEDDEIMARMYKKAFTHHGYEVSMAHDGVEGLIKIQKELPDLIVLDVMMPHMNGIEMLEKIKNDVKTQHIKVLMLTNLGVKEDIDKILGHIGVAFLTKSNTEPSVVIETVEKMLAQHG